MSSRAFRRVGVTINYLSLLCIMILFYFAKQGGWMETYFGLLLFICIAVTTITVYYVHVKTGLWKLTHTKIEKLDEREIQLTHNALRFSYSIFTILILSGVLFLKKEFIALFDFQGLISVAYILFLVLFMFAHTLPASIIAWNEREV